MVTLLMLTLLVGLAMAMVSIASTELRRNSATMHEQRASANARLALVLAIGQLQKEMGPDTRVSASSALVTADGQKHWTGVWNTQAPDDRPWVRRDAAEGSLTDQRQVSGYLPRDHVMRWLVSGGSSPEHVIPESITLVGNNSVSSPQESGVRVPAQAVHTGGERGRIAWWTGDLGQRADLASPAAAELIGKGPAIPENVRSKLVSEKGVALLAKQSDWAKNHFHDFTVHTNGLLIDNREGGLKKDLSVFLHSTGETGGAGGLKDGDCLTGSQNQTDAVTSGSRWEENPFQRTSPRFGMLRHWANLPVQDDKPLGSIVPETLANDSVSANHQPVRLDAVTRTAIHPILIEASQFHSFSWFEKSGNGPNRHHLRKHLYPRIALWNPYPIALEMPPVMVLLQINGRHDFWVEGHFPGTKGKPDFAVKSPWVAFDGGRSRDFNSADGSLFSSPGFTDPHMGSYFYQLEATRFEPGECLVFTPPAASEYRDGVDTGDGLLNLAENVLTPEMPPHPGRCLTLADPPGQQGFGFIPSSLVMESCASHFALFGMRGVTNPGDDLRVILKDATDQKFIDVETFDKLPQLSFVSGSFQYGAGRAPEPQWAGQLRVPIEKTGDQAPKLEPDGRSRQGFAMVAGTEAPFANWNPRAAFSLRSPRENLYQTDGASPNFGVYQTLPPSAASSWADRFPFAANGRQHLDPLGRGRSVTSTILFDLPRKDSGISSLGFFQHAKLSEFVWHPSRAVGNSIADPRVPLTRTLPEKREQGGFDRKQIGVSKDPARSPSPEAWADAAKAILQDLPETGEQLLHDLSYEANHALWDRYFLSGSDHQGKVAFAGDPLTHRLRNARLDPAFEGDPVKTASDLEDFHQAASRLVILGAFNVNSLSEDAWAAVLASSRQGDGHQSSTAFPRISGGVGGETRKLTDAELRRLARSIVVEVKARGPFLGMADFVNRRLAADVTGRCGALEAAIIKAGINDELVRRFPIKTPTPSFPQEISHPLEPRPEHRPESSAWGEETFLTQADILQTIGDSLVTRSDTFVIRAYGESVDRSGRTQARAWCEAVVQRTPVPVNPNATGIEPLKDRDGPDFGRRFRQIRFRWLSPNEI